MKNDGGKGSAPRKQQDIEAYSDHYSKIFGQNSWLERKKAQERLDRERASFMSAIEDEVDRMQIYDIPSDREKIEK